MRKNQKELITYGVNSYNIILSGAYMVDVDGELVFDYEPIPVSGFFLMDSTVVCICI